MNIERCRLGIVGGIRRDYYIGAEGQTHLCVLGGHGVYAAAGALIWSDDVSLYSRVGADVPGEFITRLKEEGIHLDGLSPHPEGVESRRFFAYAPDGARLVSTPAAHFLRIGMPLPKDLLDYPAPGTDDPSMIPGGPDTYLPADLPAAPVVGKSFHLCPADYRAHLLLPAHLKAAGAALITLDPAPAYASMEYRAALREIVSGLDAFLPSAEEAQELMRLSGLSSLETAQAVAELGCRIVVLKHGAGGSSVWERETARRWLVPAYPARVRDQTGAGDAYCGGFLAGLCRTGDPVEAALMGTVSASLMIEGSGAFYPLEALPGLAQARLEALRPMVRSA
jgi:sugar/nucleoside kinase (ribokinase family)